MAARVVRIAGRLQRYRSATIIEDRGGRSGSSGGSGRAMGLDMDEEARAAVARWFHGLPEGTIAALTAGARQVRAVGGAIIHREGDTAPHFDIVVRGLMRVRVAAPDGRTLTARYCPPGTAMGVATLYASHRALGFATQAVVDSVLLSLRPHVVLACTDRDPAVARILLEETSKRVLGFISEVAYSAFAPVPQRIARHLLDLASDELDAGDTRYVASITQQELADAVGTVREVVVRVLRELREARVIETHRHQITILDPERLSVSAIERVGR
jgi:CRP/FNR family transcriptional regulator, cyclic AMP receptor protein